MTNEESIKILRMRAAEKHEKYYLTVVLFKTYYYNVRTNLDIITLYILFSTVLVELKILYKNRLERVRRERFAATHPCVLVYF